MRMWQTLARWWRRDRIRASPREGEIFRLAPPGVVVIRGEAMRVTRRRVVCLASGPAVVYDCDSAFATRQLQVEATSPPRLVLFGGAEILVLREDDIEIFPGAVR